MSLRKRVRRMLSSEFSLRSSRTVRLSTRGSIDCGSQMLQYALSRPLKTRVYFFRVFVQRRKQQQQAQPGGGGGEGCHDAEEYRGLRVVDSASRRGGVGAAWPLLRQQRLGLVLALGDWTAGGALHRSARDKHADSLRGVNLQHERQGTTVATAGQARRLRSSTRGQRERERVPECSVSETDRHTKS